MGESLVLQVCNFVLSRCSCVLPKHFITLSLPMTTHNPRLGPSLALFDVFSCLLKESAVSDIDWSYVELKLSRQGIISNTFD